MRKALILAASAIVVAMTSSAQAVNYSKNNPYAAFNRSANYSAQRWEAQHRGYGPMSSGTYGNGYYAGPAASGYRSAYGGWANGSSGYAGYQPADGGYAPTNGCGCR